MTASASSANLQSEIRNLKSSAGAVILAHNYQRPDIYDVADFIGDSLELARQARATDTRLIIFCGVRFMAETAKLVNPDARVILAEPGAGCRMADMITAEALRARKVALSSPASSTPRPPTLDSPLSTPDSAATSTYPITVGYVNTPADVKAECDICCTSANAVHVVNSLPRDRRILFVPDRNLAAWVARETSRPFLDPRTPSPDPRPPSVGIIPWEGFCYVHASFRTADVERARREHPKATVIVHPECPLEVIDAADKVASTSGMVRLAAGLDEVVLGTEAGMCLRIQHDFPGKRCWPLRRTALCENMKLTRLEHVLAALQGQVPEVTVPAEIAVRARAALDRMLAVA